jgi:transcriptional regulator with XRE-family HTH domain
MDMHERIKSRIVSQRTTQENIANKIGIHPGSFRRWMSNKTIPNVCEAYIIAQELRTSIEYLVDGEAGVKYLKSLPWYSSPSEALMAAEKEQSYESIDSIIKDIRTLSRDDLCDIQALVSSKIARRRPAKLS